MTAYAVKYSWHEPVGQFSTKKAAQQYAKQMREQNRQAGLSGAVKVIKSNPAKFERCVKAVKKRGGAANAYAVCTAAGTRNKGKRKARRGNPTVSQSTDRRALGELEEQYRGFGYQTKITSGPKVKGKPSWQLHVWKNNPADAAAAAFEEFHGRESEQVVTVKQTIHYHEHLAAIGRLEALKGITAAGGKFALSDFKGALLCMNEQKNQLFIRGGNQKVDPSEFGAEAEHELYELGECRVVEYFTRKDHLGKEGGTAVYVHKFERPCPTLLYDAPNEQLLFAGGGYSMPPEGIDN